jgi:hypothetical protein
VPFDNPVIVIVESEADAVSVVTSEFVVASVMLISYPVTAFPPSSIVVSETPLSVVAITEVQLTTTLASLAETDGAAIWSGVVDGVTDEEAADAELSPTLEPVVTVQVVATPLVKLVTVMGELVPVCERDPQVAVKFEIVEPFVAPAEKSTIIWPFPAVTELTVGADGVVAAVTEIAPTFKTVSEQSSPVMSQPSWPELTPETGVAVTRIS